jgi:hypothetical protein
MVARAWTGADGAYRVRVRVGGARVLVSCLDEGRMVEHLTKLSDSVRGARTEAAPKAELPKNPAGRVAAHSPGRSRASWRAAPGSALAASNA